ncbi:MAG: N-formylglutamate amidohydrolase [Spirochaetes bacterium]|nr:N-formylglutamate amidohydrolase [Spirochaetota bacterium]
MKAKLPILMIIPHGGRTVPDELSGHEQIDEFGIFIESDACANELFNIHDVFTKANTHISRLFIDLDRPDTMLPPNFPDGVIKKESQGGRKIFKEKIFPDEIAIRNILNRYYTPFHKSIQEAVSDNEIQFILECHTMMPVGPRHAADAGRPRPLINVENTIKTSVRTMRTCPAETAENFLSCFKKYFNNEDCTVSEKFSINNPLSDGCILETYGQTKIPMLRFSISTSLYLNDKYFDYDSLTVDNLRIKELNGRILSGIEKFALKYL